MATSDLLKITYHLERVPFGEPDDDQLDGWWVALRRGEPVGDDFEWEQIAEATLYGMDPYRSAMVGEAPFDVADAHSADTAYYYEHVFDTGGDVLPDVQEQFEWLQGRALFLHDVQVAEPLRRQGYGSLLAADAILTLAPHGTAVFAHPARRTLRARTLRTFGDCAPRPRTHGSWARWASPRFAIGSGCSTSLRATRWARWHASDRALLHEYAKSARCRGALWPPNGRQEF